MKKTLNFFFKGLPFILSIHIAFGQQPLPCPPPPTANYTLSVSPSNTINAGTTVTFRVMDGVTGSLINDACINAEWFVNGIYVFSCALGAGTGSTVFAYSSNTLLDNEVITCTVKQTCDCAGSTVYNVDNPITMHVSGILPIELRNFRGNTEGWINHLVWSTASEINSKGFQVERLNSTDKVWESIGFVYSQSKAANYDFFDMHPLSINYYRLRQIDMDGHEQLSKIISLSMPFEKTLKVYPTAVSNVLNVDIVAEKKDSSFHIFNILGQQVQTGVLTQTLDVSGLALGTYILKVGTEQAKFYKQ